MSTPPRPPTPGPGAPAPPARSKRDTTRDVAALVIGGLLVAFALLNLDRVGVNWIFGTWRTPLILVIVVSMALGVAIGLLIARRRGRRR